MSISLDAYELSKPNELVLFELTSSFDSPYSNTLELYDALPKYHWGNSRRIDGRFLESLERRFEHRKKNYTLVINPARVNGKDYYPSQREEIVEDALRKLACNGQGVFLRDEQGIECAGVVFSLYELKRELLRMGHGYNTNQIKQALLVCAKTNLELISDDGSIRIVSNIFTTLGLQTRKDWKEQNKKNKGFVRFNFLVTRSINSLAFRQINYDQIMGYKKALSRWLHKRISHNFIQAAPGKAYTVQASTIIRDSGMTRYSRIKDNIRKIENALREMIAAGVVQNYRKKIINDPLRKNRIIDAKFSIYMSQGFAEEMIGANVRCRDLLSSVDSEVEAMGRQFAPRSLTKAFSNLHRKALDHSSGRKS